MNMQPTKEHMIFQREHAENMARAEQYRLIDTPSVGLRARLSAIADSVKNIVKRLKPEHPPTSPTSKPTIPRVHPQRRILLP